jgi:hypothetical protein
MGKNKAQWVRLPEGAQVTMNREAFEATQRIGPLSKVGIGAMLVAAIWLIGQTSGDDSKSDTPRPQTSVSQETGADHE